MTAKVTSINARCCNRMETALGMHLQREITKDPHVELDSIREMVDVFLLENKKRFNRCKPEKIRVMYGCHDGTDYVHVLKCSDNNSYGYYEIILITFYDDNDFFPI